jgi:hypothetical protein
MIHDLPLEIKGELVGNFPLSTKLKFIDISSHPNVLTFAVVKNAILLLVTICAFHVISEE